MGIIDFYVLMFILLGLFEEVGGIFVLFFDVKGIILLGNKGFLGWEFVVFDFSGEIFVIIMEIFINVVGLGVVEINNFIVLED